MSTIQLYDATLRDGMGGGGLSLTADEKLRVVHQLDALGVDLIEAGFPSSNPKEQELFDLLAGERLAHAEIVAFGMTRRREVAADGDEGLRVLVEAFAPVCTLVGKSSIVHVEKVVRVSREENLAMIADSVAHLVARASGRSSTPSTSSTATRPTPATRWKSCGRPRRRAPSVVVLCDTNGGCCPSQLADAVGSVLAACAGAALGHPLPRRHRLRGRQHAGRGRGGRHPRPGHGQRLRRAHRQRQPVQRRRRAAAQDGPSGGPGRRSWRG